MLIMSAIRHFTVLKAWKHTGLAKLDSSMQACGKEQGSQRIARLILHHSFVLAINNMVHFHFGHYAGHNEKILTNNFLVMNALLKVFKTFTINPVTRVSKDVSHGCLLYSIVSSA